MWKARKVLLGWLGAAATPRVSRVPQVAMGALGLLPGTHIQIEGRPGGICHMERGLLGSTGTVRYNKPTEPLWMGGWVQHAGSWLPSTWSLPNPLYDVLNAYMPLNFRENLVRGAVIP